LFSSGVLSLALFNTKDSDGKFVYNEDQSFKEQTTPTNAKGEKRYKR